jgi:pimeloyl-ACP methyl ester carboxylesterase
MDVRLRATKVIPLLVLMALFSGAQCYPTGTRVIVFIQGVYTTYDSDGTQASGIEDHRFETIKAAFEGKGYGKTALLDFSYTGGAVNIGGAWQPNPYACEQTDRRSDVNLVALEDMLKAYKARHRSAHFAIVGHSLGGYLAFLEGARDAARPAGSKLGVDVVVTIDAPLSGASPDKKAIIDLIPCDKTYEAGAEIVAQKLDPATPDVRRYQAAVMAQQGVRLATLGNTWDCLWNTDHCLPGGGFADDTSTQVLPGQAAASYTYEVDSAPLLSHDAILAFPPAVRDALAFVGAP